jgi:hypothetical protein
MADKDVSGSSSNGVILSKCFYVLTIDVLFFVIN